MMFSLEGASKKGWKHTNGIYPERISAVLPSFSLGDVLFVHYRLPSVRTGADGDIFVAVLTLPG